MGAVKRQISRGCNHCNDKYIPITKVPFTIKLPGVYCLAGNITTNMVSGNAIVIAANDVVLDLNGFTLDGTGAGEETETIGIYAFHHSNLTIRNGTVTGFKKAISIVAEYYLGDPVDNADPSDANIVEQIRAIGNTSHGIEVYGPGSVIRDNLVVNTGAFGIILSDSIGLIADNTVVKTGFRFSGNSPGFGIYLIRSGGVVKNNCISLVKSRRDNHGACIIINYRSEGVILSDNRLSSSEVGIMFSEAGEGPGEPGRCKYTNTITSRIGTLVEGTGGIAVGIND